MPLMLSRASSVLGSLAFLVIAPGMVAGYVPYLISGWRWQPPLLGLAASRLAGGLLVLAGAASVVHSFARFALEGRGTPAPVAPTQTLVVSGQYRYVRNPMYVAVVGIVLGQALLFGSLPLVWYALGLWALFHAFVLGYEEPTLARRYGDSYARYRTSVNRWLPRPPRG
jgi:protein-S-isoprenylcysteine O-methyltransferase Ste14